MQNEDRTRSPESLVVANAQKPFAAQARQTPMAKKSLDIAKVRRLLQLCESHLRRYDISDRTQRDWLQSNELQVQSGSFRKLGDALSAISGGRWAGDELLLNHEPPLSEFDRQLTEFLRGVDTPGAGTAPPAILEHVVRAEEAPAADRLLSRYCRGWREAISSPDFRRIAQLRLDRYVWPGLSWERPSRRPERDSVDREPIPGQGQAPTVSMLHKLLQTRRVILHDDAGMGKTAFSYKCLDLLLCESNWEQWFAGLPPLVVRLEGRWPRRDPGTSHSTSGSNARAPLRVRELLVAELLRGLKLFDGRDPLEVPAPEVVRAADAEVSEALRDRRVVMIVDAFDQMTQDDREFVSTLMGHDQLDEGADPDAGRCAWLLTGRAYAIRHYEDRWAPRPLRLRLERFSTEQQDAYFADLAEHEFFRQRRVRPLDWICQPRSNLAEDLGLPLNLREVRTLVEDGLSTWEASPESSVAVLEANRISTTGQLHALVARILLERALRHVRERREQDWRTKGQPLPAPPQAGEPETNDLKLQALMRVCGLLALQMMLDENYNASVDTLTRRPGEPGMADGVKLYLERARQRFLASMLAQPSETGREVSADRSAVENRWAWAVAVLQEIELSHRGHIDAFNAECRSFRDRKTMEWYAAYYLMNYATRSDLYETIPGAGDRCVLDFAADNEWGSNCWRQAIEMPRGQVQEHVAIESLGVLFERPSEDGARQPRPCELMWLAWERWLEPRAASVDTGGGPPRPLRGAAELIGKFRQEFEQLCADGNDLALSLRLDPRRDEPDKKLGNKTTQGQYRRIPPAGPSTSFRGERPVAVTVSAFWLRKFVVTNAEYRLFDPHFESGYSAGFDSPNRPVVGVTWYAAAMFCRWLGADYRLPTEAEWEAACRAGKETAYWFGPSERSLKKHAWYDDNSEGRTHELADSVKAGGHENPWGLYDMHGNVWEWCLDWYGEYDQREVVDPCGPAQASDRVSRGGSWASVARRCRAAFRNWGVPQFRYQRLGFRLAAVPTGGAGSKAE